MLITLQQVLELAERLSPLDKVRLIEHIVPQLEQAPAPPVPRPRVSLRGLWKGLDITDADLADARREIMANFPRLDI